MRFSSLFNRQNLGGVLVVSAVVAAATLSAATATPAQDSSAETNMFRGDRPVISVKVRDSGGAEIGTPATVRISSSGMTMDQGQTSKGSVFFMLTSTGEYSVQVTATGYESRQKDVTI